MTTLRQLEYLVTVVDQGSFTKAAELLHVTQPALSHQIRTLERSAGGPLLERLPRNVRLTPTGRAMLLHARAALADADRSRCAARQAAGLEVGELQIATLYSITLGVLPKASVSPPRLSQLQRTLPLPSLSLQRLRPPREIRFLRRSAPS